MVRPSSRKVALGIVALAGILAAGEPARAEFVSGFTGHTLLANQPGSDAVVNFAVYRVTDADFRDDAAFAGSNLFGAFSAGVGSRGLDLGATHVLLFQVTNFNVNPAQAEGAIRSLSVPWGGGYTSWGVLRDMVFTDAAGNVAHWNCLGDCAEPTDPDVAGDGIPTFNHADDPGFAYVPLFPTSERVKNADIVAHKGEFLAAIWDPTLGNGIPTASGPRSSSLVVATTRSHGIQYGPGQTEGILGGSPQTPSDGDIPHPSPEPGALVLAAMTLPGLLLVRRRRRAVA